MFKKFLKKRRKKKREQTLKGSEQVALEKLERRKSMAGLGEREIKSVDEMMRDLQDEVDRDNKSKENGKLEEKIKKIKKEIEDIYNKLDNCKGYDNYCKYTKKLDRKIAVRDLAVRKNLRHISDKELIEIGVDKDSIGKIILYHITNKENFSKIISQGKLKPSAETGARIWRLEGESGGSKNKQVYLCKKNEVKKIKSQIPGAYAVLEVHVDETKLMPDEDSKEDNWIASLKGYFGTCAHRGSIDNFKVLESQD
jgi:hypothetical protein|tara:strand:+ start:137 stop:898 length:762 start_codon:yes stop_codon:yes gene_type:complete